MLIEVRQELYRKYPKRQTEKEETHSKTMWGNGNREINIIENKSKKHKMKRPTKKHKHKENKK